MLAQKIQVYGYHSILGTIAGSSLPSGILTVQPFGINRWAKFAMPSSYVIRNHVIFLGFFLGFKIFEIERERTRPKDGKIKKSDEGLEDL